MARNNFNAMRKSARNNDHHTVLVDVNVTHRSTRTSDNHDALVDVNATRKSARTNDHHTILVDVNATHRSIHTITLITALSILTILATNTPCPAQLKAVRQLTSNNIIALAGGTGGSGDTLWAATEHGFNYRLPSSPKDEWLGFEAGNLRNRFFGLAFGGSFAAALVSKENDVNDSIGFWSFSHASAAQKQKFFRFPQGVRGDSAQPTSGVIYSNGSFWAPFNHGGIVRYDPINNTIHAIRPGDDAETPTQNILALGDDGVDTKAVLMVDANHSDNSITVTTPSTIWRYQPIDKSWDALHTSPTFAAIDVLFVSFEAAFTISKNGASTLYSFMTVRDNGEDRSVLYALDAASNTWVKAIDSRALYALFPAALGCFYTLSENSVSLYADTSTISTDQENFLSVVMKPAEFRDMLKAAGDNPNPEINDILFLPKTDSSGMLAVATATGLYVCESAYPLSNRYDGFTHSYYVRAIGTGETYALPGIMRGGADGRYEKCVFVYKLKKDGNVTIRVYDYNMSLVKTIVKSERRVAQAGRSTNPARDLWDGTNNANRRVWPGVYYFKITSTSGERLFGKVILAK